MVSEEMAKLMFINRVRVLEDENESLKRRVSDLEAHNGWRAPMAKRWNDIKGGQPIDGRQTQVHAGDKREHLVNEF